MQTTASWETCYAENLQQLCYVWLCKSHPAVIQQRSYREKEEEKEISEFQAENQQ